MSTTIHPAGHPATISNAQPGVSSPEAILEQVHRREKIKIPIIQSSFKTFSDESATIIPQTHGFVHTAIQAYNQHHHLILRPEDIWFAILSQLNIYINAHAEELRHIFVSHEGKKELEVVDIGSLKSADFGGMARQMASLIEKNILDPSLRAWIQPSFSTTTTEDVTVSAVMMMGALQAYFSYKMSLMCGLPSVTLLGEKKDWEEILGRLERIKDLGEEPKQWYSLLVPVVTKFIKSFDEPDGEATRDFWQKIAHYSGGGSGPTYLSGWITAFCFWSKQGRCMYGRVSAESILGRQPTPLVLSGITYHIIDSDDVPPGHASVPVTVNDNGNEFATTMLAGLVGMKMTSSGQPGVPPSRGYGAKEEGSKDRAVGLDTVQPVSGWFMFETVKGKEETGKESWSGGGGGGALF